MQQKIGVIGGGNMGGAIIAGIAKQYSVSVCEQRRSRAAFLKKKFKVATGSLEAVIKRSDVVLLAVKPQGMDGLLKVIKPLLTKDKLVISIAAGITTRYIEKRLGAKMRVVRTMPNLPVQAGKGLTGICPGRSAARRDLILACRLFSCVGQAIVVEEKWMDAITAVSGSGPAYVFLFVEHLQKAATALGLEKSLAKQLVMQTLEGSLALLKIQKKDAGELRKMVTSKGGTTQAAMDIFNKKNSDKIFIEALKAAKKRAKELSR